MTTLNERFQKGVETRTKFTGGGPIGSGSVLYSQELAPDLHRIALEALFGTVWQRTGLPIHRREMVTLSVLTVLQREDQLTCHVANALNLGLTPQQVVEVMIHASWYGGMHPAFNAMGVAKGVFYSLGIDFQPKLVFDPNETPDDLARRGAARREELMGPPPADPPEPVTRAERDFNRLSTEYYWGSVWNRPGLELADRSICTLACLSVLGREGPLRSHIGGALHIGLTPEEIVEVFVHACFYGGIPFTRAAIDAANEIFRARGLG